MLRLLGSEKRSCDGFSRRDLLQIGGLGMFGFGLSDFLRWQSDGRTNAALAADSHNAAPQKSASKDGGTFGRAKSCILLFPFGSPPQHETFDPKPKAPVEVQGMMKGIDTALPGVQIGEGLPRIAKIMDRMTVIRSMTHPYPLHGVAYALTGVPTYTPANEANPRALEHWPYIGSIVDYLGDKRTPGVASPIPRHMGLPWRFGSKSSLAQLAGPYASFLGEAYDPMWTDFDGKGTKVVPKLTDDQKNDVLDPFGGTVPEGRFSLADGGRLSDEVSPGRLDARRLLLSQFDRAKLAAESSQAIKVYDHHQQKAFSLLTTSHVRDALDIQRETSAVRERYGMTLFGQSCLAARRLVETGVQFVSVFWDPFEPFGGSCWDTHANHYPRLKDYLLPVFDQSYSALIEDLEQRGMLDETLVVCVSEHGRTPQIDNKPRGAGRHHWSRVYSAALAGGGAARGKIVGRSDNLGGEVAETPVSPKDVLATTFHLLGIDPHTLVRDRLNRPTPVAGDGEFRPELC